MERVPTTSGGKRQRREAPVNAVTGHRGDLLYVHDSKNNVKWLVDSGALYSIVPPTLAQRAQGPQGEHLQAANGSKIQCFGHVEKEVVLGNKSYRFDFVVADVKNHILGADFMAEFYLGPNQRDCSLIDLSSFSSIPTVIAQGETPSHMTFVNEVNDPYYKLLDQYPDIMTPTFTLKEVKHGIKHHIPTEGHPVQFRARRLNPEKLAVAKEELGKLEKLGVCYRGKSEWASPLMVTTKPDGGWRVCGDYRRLNSMTPDDRYPVRTLSDFTSELQGKKIFSKIDMLKGYHQIPVAEEDVCKTAVITPFGLFIFPRTPFGLKNAGQDFQRLMDQIFGDIPHTFVYIDDILVASETEEEHLHDLKVVLDLLRENGLVTNRKKCILGRSSIEFLGYQVDENGISPLPERVDAIRQIKRPTTVKELQRFLGMVNYYRKFIPRAAHHLHHLFDALKGKPKELVWDEGCTLSFEATKEALARATLLHHPRTDALLALTTDASQYAVGGVLEQWGPRGWEPLSFYSSKLNNSQQLWPPYDRELLGAFKSVRHFRPMLEGRPFTLFTDHLSLVPSVSKKTDPQTSRQAYQLSALAEYTTDFRYIQGKSNVVADSLSRPPGVENPDTNAVSYQERDQNSPSDQRAATTEETQSSSAAAGAADPVRPLGSIPTAAHSDINNNNEGETAHSSSSFSSSSSSSSATAPLDRAVKREAKEDLDCLINSVRQMNIDLEEMARDQALDPDFRRIASDARTGLQLRAIEVGDRKLIVDISNGPARPFVPFSWRRKIFDLMHGLGHPGLERTRQTVSEKFVWPSLRQDVSKWARECQHCQRSKVLRHVTPSIGDFQVPDKRFEHLNLDLVTLTPSNGYKYLVTIVDCFSRFPTAIPIKDMTVETILDAFAHGWVATFGVPSSITTDRGSQFLSAAWGQLMSTWGIKTHTTTAYHPEANGLVERLHRRLKEALLACSHDHPEEWYWKLPSVLLSIRTTLKPDLGASPAEMVFGEPIAVPGSILSNAPSDGEQLQQHQRQTLANLRLEVARLQPVPTSAHRRQNVRLPEELQSCSHVFVRKGGVQPCLSAAYSGPYRVLSRQEHFFKISIPGRGAESVALSRLKPAVIARDEEFQQRTPSPVTPPSPPPPGRPPGRRARQPQPTDRRARRQGGRNTTQPSTSNSTQNSQQREALLPLSPTVQRASSPPPPPSPSMHADPLPPPSPPPASHFSPPPARPPAARGRRSPRPPRCFLEDSPPRPHLSMIEERAPLPASPTTINEPNSAYPQQPMEEMQPAAFEPLSDSSARTRPRPVIAARAAAASSTPGVPDDAGGPSGLRGPSLSGEEPIFARAAAAASAAPPRRFFTSPSERNFSADRRKRDRPNVSYAASLSHILRQQLTQ